jgi:hypothetical protein
MVINAIHENKIESTEYQCQHICIEPYEQPWLEKVDVELKRNKVEELDLSLFNILEENDILFIDSSHVIRPQGDVLFEILEILPILNSGVIIHIHDIFTPKDYLDEWIYQDKKLWNEQYLLEAFEKIYKYFYVNSIVGSEQTKFHFKNDLSSIFWHISYFFVYNLFKDRKISYSFIHK